MHETEPDKQFADNKAPVDDFDDIKQILMLQVALLMRLYDVNMALLNQVDEKTADDVFEAHHAGRHFNPPTMIPVLERQEDEE